MARKNGAAKKTDVIEELDTRDLPVSLTEKEDIARRKDLEAAAALVADIEHEMKEKAAEFREQLKSAEADRDRLIRVVTTRTELRPTEVLIEKDFDEEEVRVIRLDTGMVYERRDLTPEDRQGDIEDVLPPRHGGDAVTDKPPAGEGGKKLVGGTKKGDVEAPTPEAGGWPNRPAPMWDGK
jgi:hypothetical protein